MSVTGVYGEVCTTDHKSDIHSLTYTSANRSQLIYRLGHTHIYIVRSPIYVVRSQCVSARSKCQLRHFPLLMLLLVTVTQACSAHKSSWKLWSSCSTCTQWPVTRIFRPQGVGGAAQDAYFRCLSSDDRFCEALWVKNSFKSPESFQLQLTWLVTFERC